MPGLETSPLRQNVNLHNHYATLTSNHRTRPLSTERVSSRQLPGQHGEAVHQFLYSRRQHVQQERGGGMRTWRHARPSTEGRSEPGCRDQWESQWGTCTRTPFQIAPPLNSIGFPANGEGYKAQDARPTMSLTTTTIGKKVRKSYARASHIVASSES